MNAFWAICCGGEAGAAQHGRAAVSPFGSVNDTDNSEQLGAFSAAPKTGLCGGSVPPHGHLWWPRPSNPLRVSHPFGVSVFKMSADCAINGGAD
ncbi:MAG: hypothetical protein LBK61_02555 [Spirochaetaceae bacterium]|nr:hypothetical protein [Spirochaetaceae bacterium]